MIRDSVSNPSVSVWGSLNDTHRPIETKLPVEYHFHDVGETTAMNDWTE